MRPREFYDLAAQMAAVAKRPAEFRTAISRSYYAAYHVARELMTTLGGQFNPTDRETHVDVRRHLERSGNTVLVAVANDLRTLHNDRKTADYNIRDLTIEKQNEALARVSKALVIIEKIDKQCSGPEKTAIRSAITGWVAAGKPRI